MADERHCNNPATLAVHAGEEVDETGALDIPLVFSSAFAFEDSQSARAVFEHTQEGFIYSRWGNPTVSAFERKMAALEGAEEAVAVASGMAAISGALGAFLRAGDHVVAPASGYAETGKLLRGRLAKWGVATTFVDMTDLGKASAAFTARTNVLYVESPSNPVLAVTDLRAASELAKARGAALIVDNTFATPYHQNPLELGADVVIHSATKAIGGHGDAIGGVVLGSNDVCKRVREEAVRESGAVMSPFVAWLLCRGLRTLALRADRASANALHLAEWLAAQKQVARVHYPGLASHPGHAVAAAQMKRGFGAMLAFEMAGGLEAARRVYDRAQLIARAVSLGDVRSLMTHPAATTHASMSADMRLLSGITDGLIRFSVGIEDVDDLKADLARGFQS